MKSNDFLKLTGTMTWGIFIWSVFEWSSSNAKTWAITLIPLFTIGTIYAEYYKWITFPKSENNFKKYKDETGKCLFNGYHLALLCRIIALLLAVVQILVLRESKNWEAIVKDINSTTNVKLTLPNDFEQYYIYAAVGSMFYVVSGIVLCISLCQCAVTFQPNEKLFVLSWGLHDLILGFIWEALALQFHDVVDDNDDSHWRSLFSSMIVFHILTILFNIWNNKDYNINWFKSKTFRICSDETELSILMLFRFLLYCVIYYWTLIRLHTNDKMLISMGWNKWGLESIVASTGIIIIINLVDRNVYVRKKIAVKTKGNISSSLNF